MNNPGQKPEIPEKDLELALCAYANDVEGQFPESDEEILAMFKALAHSPMPEPDPGAFARMLKTETREDTRKQRPNPFVEWWHKVTTGVFDSGAGEFGPIAAREGKKLSFEAQQKRQAARRANRKKKGTPPNGPA